MTDDLRDSGDDDPQSKWNSPSAPESIEIRHSQVSALVPEKVSRGVFSTGAVVLQGPYEFVIDFLLRITHPHQVAARVVLPPQVVARLILALRENLNHYKATYGRYPLPSATLPGSSPPPQAGPAGEPASSAGESAASTTAGAAASRPGTLSPTTAEDLYDQLKLPEALLSGTYSNAVMIGHTASEFSFDFITTFFPRSAVSCRVFLAAPNAVRFLDSLTHSYEQYQKQLKRATPPPDPPPQET